MQINSRTKTIKLTKQECKELRRAAETIRTIQKFQDTEGNADLPAYLEGIAETLGGGGDDAQP